MSQKINRPCCKQFDGLTNFKKITNGVHVGKFVCAHCNRWQRFATPDEVREHSEKLPDAKPKKPRKPCCANYADTPKTRVEKGEWGVHTSKRVCDWCSHFISWTTNEKNNIEYENRRTTIDKMIEIYGGKLREADRIFLENIKECRYMTPRQFNYLTTMRAKILTI